MILIAWIIVTIMVLVSALIVALLVRTMYEDYVRTGSVIDAIFGEDSVGLIG